MKKCPSLAAMFIYLVFACRLCSTTVCQLSDENEEQLGVRSTLVVLAYVLVDHCISGEGVSERLAFLLRNWPVAASRTKELILKQPEIFTRKNAEGTDEAFFSELQIEELLTLGKRMRYSGKGKGKPDDEHKGGERLIDCIPRSNRVSRYVSCSY